MKVPPVTINGDGSFTAKISGLNGIKGITTLYLKDEVNAPSVEWKTASVTIESIIVNNKVALDLTQTTFNAIVGTAFDVPFINVWATSSVKNIQVSGQAANILDNGAAVAIDSVEIKFTISGLNAKAVTEATTTSAETTTTEATTTETTTASPAEVSSEETTIPSEEDPSTEETASEETTTEETTIEETTAEVTTSEETTAKETTSKKSEEEATEAAVTTGAIELESKSGPPVVMIVLIAVGVIVVAGIVVLIIVRKNRFY